MSIPMHLLFITNAGIVSHTYGVYVKILLSVVVVFIGGYPNSNWCNKTLTNGVTELSVAT